MKRFHVYQIKVINYDALIGVDTNAAALLLRMADDLRIADLNGGLEKIEVGIIAAESVDEAINRVRAGEWMHTGFGAAKGVS